MPAKKRGRLSKEEMAFIVEQAPLLTPEEIATRMNRKASMVCDFIQDHNRGLAKPILTKEDKTIRSELRNSEKWRRLKEELTDDEIRFFEEEYIKLKGQFRDDVLPSEETQVFDCIKFEILKSRNMAERKRAREEIKRLEKVQDEFLARFDGDPSKMKDAQKAFLLSLETQLQAARSAEQNRTTEYVQLQGRHDALMKSLKSTRDQRIREVESGKETILGLLKMLQKREVQEHEGRQMELMRIAAQQEYKRLGQLHEYEDGQVDRPILSADTIGDDDE